MSILGKNENRSSAIGEAAPKKRPLYRSITDTLRQQLMDGDLAAGARMPALRELAKKFNVSTITIRQALRVLEQEGRLHCIPGVGSFVRPTLPRETATEQITVAFVTIEIEGAYTSEIAHSIEEECQQRGWGMQLFNAQGFPHLEARNLSRLAKTGANAAIIVPVSDNENLEEMVRLKLADFPFVLVDRSIPGLKVDVVASDHEKGAYMATDYLLSQGHRKILMVGYTIMSSSITARIQGYEQALIDHGLEPLREWKVWIKDEAILRGCREHRPWLGGYEAVKPLLKKIEPPIAVFAQNSYSGWGVFEACREMGLNIPQEVSIICFDDSEFKRALTPHMTAIAQRTYEIGRLAVELLESRLSRGNTDDPQQILVDVDLVERESVSSLLAD
ncbi:MAG: GntR family transcriptional regulator [Planctomycetota bacterium]|nr:MAG: GntR family transcriptional regulator [Planctomycetota bacterium]